MTYICLARDCDEEIGQGEILCAQHLGVLEPRTRGSLQGAAEDLRRGSKGEDGRFARLMERIRIELGWVGLRPKERR
jgi:hypothetical protein